MPGVGEVYQFGPLDYSMRIWLSSAQLTALRLTPTDVINAIRAQNVQAAVGRIGAQPMTDDQQFQISLQTQGRLSDAAEFEQIVVRANPDGSTVRVKDVGRVELGSKQLDSVSRLNGGDSRPWPSTWRQAPTPWRWATASRRPWKISPSASRMTFSTPSSTTPPTS